MFIAIDCQYYRDYFSIKLSKANPQAFDRLPEKNGLRIATKTLLAQLIESLDPIDRIDG
jgi:hypothetical protein